MTLLGTDAGTRDTTMIAIITDTGIMNTSIMVKSVVNVVKVIVSHYHDSRAFLP